MKITRRMTPAPGHTCSVCAPDWGSVHTTRVYGTWTRVSNTGVTLDSRVHGPCWQAPIRTTREHGPYRRPVFTGSAYLSPVSTCRDASASRRYMDARWTSWIQPVNTAVITSVQTDTRIYRPCIILDTREHGPWRWRAFTGSEDRASVSTGRYW